MGAEIDVPPKASRERIAAKLGPGPAREILSSLLSWTDYNYLIQASNTDPDGIQSITLISRPKSSALATSGGAPGQPASSWTRRQGPAEAQPREEAEKDDSSEESAQTSIAAAPQNSSEHALAANTPSAATVEAVATAQPSAADQGATPELAAATAATSDAAPPQDKNEERMMQLQSLYGQRKQMIEEARKPPAQN